MHTMLVNPGLIIAGIYEKLGRGNRDFCDQLDHSKSWEDRRWTSLGLSFSLRCSAKLGDRTDVEVIHIIVAGNAVHVWIAEHAGWTIRDVPLDSWVNVSNHDSCWRSAIDDYITQVYFRLCEKVQDHLPEDQQVAPAKVEVTADFDFIRIFSWMQVEFKVDPTDHFNYKLKLTHIRETGMRCVKE